MVNKKLSKRKSPPEHIDDSEMDFNEGDFTPIQEQSTMQILNAMLTPENVFAHTEIDNPLNLTRLETLAKWCGDEKATDCEKTLVDFVENFRKNMVSYKRQRSKEIIQALTETIKEERRLSEKLMSPPQTGET